MNIKFKSFSSGSAGNCYFLGIADERAHIQSGILIDAGISLRRLKKELENDHLSLDDFQAILVTHDHMDHIRSLGSYCKRLKRPVWATENLHTALSHHFLTQEYIAGFRKVLKKDITEVAPDIKVKWFVVPHDASETVGFEIIFQDTFHYVHITDCGRMTPEALEACAKADSVTIESNYDYEMLRGGSYPLILQDRICGGNGHMSNAECAAAIKQFWHPGLRNIFLCHLSENNNTPELAYASAREALGDLEAKNAEAKSTRLQTLPRQAATPLINL